MPRNEIEVQYEAPGVDTPGSDRLARYARLALDHAGAPGSLTIRVVDRTEGRALNRAYRGPDRPTNVLAFPFDLPPGIAAVPADGEPGGDPGPVPGVHLGDVVICAEVVAAEAREQGKPSEHHWAHLVVHGTLHLLGFDHDSEAAANRMEALERELLAEAGVPDPYRAAGVSVP